MITPADIEKIEFTRAYRGYDKQEVDEFLDKIIVDMEKLIKENAELKAQLSRPVKKDDDGLKTETSVYETLIAAKALMSDIAASADKRAKSLIRNAELEADLITKEAKESIAKYAEESARLKERIVVLRDRYKQMLETEIERIDYFAEDLIGEVKDVPQKKELKEDDKSDAEKKDTEREQKAAAKALVEKIFADVTPEEKKEDDEIYEEKAAKVKNEENTEASEPAPVVAEAIEAPETLEQLEQDLDKTIVIPKVE